MPSIRYYNQTAPFWDFVASLEDQGANHPFFARSQDNTEGQDNQEGEAGDPPTSAPEDPWSSWQGWPGWQRPRGRRGHHQPPTGDGEHPSTPAAEGDNSENPPPPPDAGEGPSNGPPPHPHHPFGPGPHRRGPHPHFRGFGPRGRGGHCGRGRGGFGGWWAPYINPAGINPMMGRGLGEFLSQMFNPEQAGSREAQGTSQDFEPEADVFDTESSFVVHVSLPGAKKEDVGVNWDPEKSELSVAGVIYRPGDEEFLKTLALDERKVGAFEKKVRLGSRANPAQVDVERITAHLEDGVLRVEVPKLDKDWQEIKKVDIE